MANSESVHNTAEAVPSPPISMAIDTRTAQGMIYKGCKCPPHREIYSDRPARNAKLTIAQCMKTCVYCGRDYTSAAELRKHMRRTDYARRIPRIRQETRGKGSATTPAWITRHHTETPIHRSDSEPQFVHRMLEQLEPISHKQCQRSSTSMTGHQELRVLQYNVQKSRDVVLASLFQDPRILEYDILAIYEPWRNPFTATSYHPLKTLPTNPPRRCYHKGTLLYQQQNRP